MWKEAFDLCDERCIQRHKKYTSDEARAQYRKTNKEVRKKMKAAKEGWIEDQCKAIDKGMAVGNSKGSIQHPQDSH